MDRTGTTALHRTSKFGSLPMVLKLLEHIDPNTTQSEGMTVLHYACWQNRPASVIRAILFHGGRDDIVDDWKHRVPSQYLPPHYLPLFQPAILHSFDVPLLPLLARVTYGALADLSLLPEGINLLVTSYLAWHVL